MRTGLRLIKLVALLAVLTTVTNAWAQGDDAGRRNRRGGGMGGGPGANPVMLLQSESVQKELNLTDEQKTSLTKLSDEQRDAYSGMQDLSREERQQKMTEQREKSQKELKEILKPDQADRLEQIGLQVAGARALTRPDVADKLGLSEEQKGKLNELMPRGGRGGGGGGGGPPAEGGAGGGGAGGAGGNMRAMRDELNTKAMDILTAEQREQFEKMQGKKVDIDPSELFRGRGGQGGRGNQKAPDA